jgi:uncharacterized protein (TIGR02646 family)
LKTDNGKWALKKINKSSSPNNLTRYAQIHPQDNWDDFRASNQGADYQEIKALIFSDQGHICAFCENAIYDFHQQCIEHFHQKSDNQSAHHNWALDWNNVIGVCSGGRDVDKSHFSLPANLSCDAYKGHLITINKLSIHCEGYLLNPLQLPAFPCLFDLDKRTGELKPKTDYDHIGIENNHYDSLSEMVEKTIENLNLNCDRLNQQRLAVLKQYNQEIKKARTTNNIQIHLQLAERWFRQKWPSFFTTRRILLGDHAETYLENIQYTG